MKFSKENVLGLLNFMEKNIPNWADKKLILILLGILDL